MEDNDVAPGDECPLCGEKDGHRLLWQEDGETVECTMCGTQYRPLGELEEEEQDE